MSFIKKYYPWFFLIGSFFIGLIRYKQIDTYENLMGKPTMSSEFTLATYIIGGTLLTILFLIIKKVLSLKVDIFTKIGSIVMIFLSLVTLILLIKILTFS